MKIDPKMTVSEFITHYPSSIDVFIKRKMPCIGCPAEMFHTIEEAARFNGILLEYLLNELQNEVSARGES